MTGETIEIDVDILRETEAALLVSDGGRQVWLPKSQIENPDDLSPGDSGEIIVPVWLAEEKGLV